jgi:hypothetical protein
MGKGVPGKKKTYQKKNYESDCSSSDTSANIYHSMLMSEAWNKLSSKQRVLYLVCKDRLYAQKTKYSPDPNDQTKFYLNRALWLKDYELYPPSNEAGFYKDMGALIEYGFIKCIESGATSRTKNIYQYSDKWKLFGTPYFKIMPNEMSGYLLNRKKKENKS